MKIKKIKAFTLSEMLVVLIISSIVISLAFLVISMVREQVSILQKSYGKKQQIQQIERILLWDLNSYTAKAVSKEALLLTSTTDTIRWNFYKEYVIRNSDTINVLLTDKKLFLDGRSVEIGYFDAIQLNFSKAYANYELFVYKTKDAAYYLNH